MYKYQHRGTRLKKNLQCVSKAINVWRISLSSSLLISFGVIASMNWPRFKAEEKHINIAASVKFWQPFMSWVHANKSTLEHKLKNQFDTCTNHDQTTHTQIPVLTTEYLHWPIFENKPAVLNGLATSKWVLSKKRSKFTFIQPIFKKLKMISSLQYSTVSFRAQYITSFNVLNMKKHDLVHGCMVYTEREQKAEVLRVPAT